jgi:hypothetical protein
MEFHAIAMPQIGPGKGAGPDGRDDFGRELVTVISHIVTASELLRFATVHSRLPMDTTVPTDYLRAFSGIT